MIQSYWISGASIDWSLGFSATRNKPQGSEVVMLGKWDCCIQRVCLRELLGLQSVWYRVLKANYDKF